MLFKKFYELFRVYRNAADADRNMEVRPQNVAGVPALGYELSFLNILIELHVYFRQMHIDGVEAEAVVNNNGIAVIS